MSKAVNKTDIQHLTGVHLYPTEQQLEPTGKSNGSSVKTATDTCTNHPWHP